MRLACKANFYLRGKPLYYFFLAFFGYIFGGASTNQQIYLRYYITIIINISVSKFIDQNYINQILID